MWKRTTPRKNKATPENGVEKSTPQRCGRKEEKMNKVELGKRVKIIRKHFGLSQAQFAQKINRSPGYLSNLEKGNSGISEETAKIICTAVSSNSIFKHKT